MRKEVRLSGLGMSRDTSVSKASNEKLFDALNMRITVNDDDNSFSLTTEQSTKPVADISGIVLGHAVINDKAVIFVKDGSDDIIYQFSVEGRDNRLVRLFTGSLGFNYEYPIETRVMFESSKIEKVYWVDGINVPRVIRLGDKRLPKLPRDTKHFDFPACLDYNERVDIEKIYSGGGSFPSGVIQYFFTYWNRFGRETAVFHTSPLYYLTHNDRGAAPDEVTTQVFKIKVDGLQSKDYDMLRVYSIHRTTLNAMPSAYVVSDIDIEGKTSIEIVDDNKTSRVVEPTSIHFLGSDGFIPYTLTSKDNTAFFGNYYNSRKEFIDYKVELNTGFSTKDKIIGGKSMKLTVAPFKDEFYFDFNLHLPQNAISFFNRAETYRFAVHFQHRNGKWSNPVYIGEYKPQYSYSIADGFYKPNMITWEIPRGLIAWLKTNGYVRAQGLVSHPLDHEREIIAQGLLNPCMYNVGDRLDNSPYVQPSWFFRPNPPFNHLPSLKTDELGPCVAEFRHNRPIGRNKKFNGEIVSYENDDDSPVPFLDEKRASLRSCRYAIDRSFASLYTPETLNEFFSYNQEDVDLSVIGVLPITKSIKKVDIITDGAPKGRDSNTPGDGFIRINPFNASNEANEEAYRTLLNIPCYGEYSGDKDTSLRINYDGPGISNRYRRRHSDYFHEKRFDSNSTFCYIFPFHNTGGLCFNKSGDNKSSVLKSKTLYNYRYSPEIKGINPIDVPLSDSVYILSDSDRLYQISHNNDKKFYKSWVDKVITTSGYKNDSVVFSYSQTCLPGIPDNEYYKKGISFYENYTNPVRVSYRTSKHILLSLDKSILPGIYSTFIREYSTTVRINHAFFGSTPAPDRKEHVVFNSYKDKERFYEFLKDFKEYSEGKPFEILSYTYDDNEPRRVLIELKNDMNGKSVFSAENLKGFYASKDSDYNKKLKEQIKDHTIETFIESNDDTQWVKYHVRVYGDYSHILASYLINRFKSTEDKYKIIYYEYKTSSDPKSTVYIFRKYINKEDLSKPKSEIADESVLRNLFETFSYDVVTPYNLNNVSLEHSLWNFPYGYMLIGNLIRRNPNRVKNIEDLTFLPAGEAIKIDEDYNVPFTYGDYYYQRYNCLGTMALKEGMENNIVDVMSFMVETRQNINGIYDRNRASADFYNINEKNYSLMNPAYNQENNFFTYRILNREIFDHGKYPNKVMWTKTKSLGEEIDQWIHLTGISSLDLDGTYGAITKLESDSNNIIAFQENAISSILFNPRVQIETSDGTPIEISNSGKVQGYRYISDSVGCQNKWTVCNGANGFVFIDDYSDVMYILGSKGLTPFSEQNGFRTYFDSRANRDRYNPLNGGSITFYDSYRMDNYLVSSDGCLGLSGRIGAYESFFGYQDAKAMFNLKDKLYSVANGHIWQHRADSFLSLYGVNNEFMVSWKVSADGESDKIFTNLEGEVDSYNESGELKDENNLKAVEVETTHQKGSVDLEYKVKSPAIKKKKFKGWGIDLPRQNGSMNRMRDRWCKLTVKGKDLAEKTIIHNLKVIYHEQ